MLQAFFFSKHAEKDEQIITIIHRHWLIGMKYLFWPSVSFLFSWAVLYQAPTRLMFWIVSLWSITSLVVWLRNFFDYYLDTWIITDRGIIDLEWQGWFHRQSARILYSDVQGVSYEIAGIAGTVFRYGTVSVEKISTGTAISLPNVGQPRQVESIILENMEQYLHKKNLKNAKHVQELLSDFVAQRMQIESVPKAPSPLAP